MMLKDGEISSPQTKPGQETKIHVNISKSIYSYTFLFCHKEAKLEAFDQVVRMEIQAAGEMVEENHSKRFVGVAIRT